MILRSVNPATDALIAEYNEHSDKEVNTIIDKAGSAFVTWKSRSFSQRAEVLIEVSRLLKEQKSDLGRLMTDEMGKPIKSSFSEIEKCASVCDFYAENSEAFLKNELVKTEASKSFVSFQPLGTVLAVMPWNFPFWQVFRFLAPALMAGNTALLKHASNVQGCALAIENLFKKAGCPEGVFSTLLLSSKRINQVIENPVIKAVTLTGSTNAGKEIAAKAGSLLKKSVLELGGSDPYIILEDAEIRNAARICAESRLINTGQSCIAAKRFIVVEKVYDEFLTAFKQFMEGKRMGDPTQEDVSLGPLARKDLRDILDDQVKRSIEKGAVCILGGEIQPGKGAYYPATILVNVSKGMPAYDEELFGPVASVIKVKNEQEAIEVANDNVFGLGACVFTIDLEKGERIAEFELESGSCFVNAFVRSDARLPFGGIKESGYGRELFSFGIREFVNIKTVYVA